MITNTAKPTDVMIIGGGPVGSYAALNLAKLGVKVTVFEEHPEIGKPSHCAGHLSIRSLRSMGLYPLPNGIVEAARSLRGTLEAITFGENANEISRVPVGELTDRLSKIEGAHTLLFDGVITQRLLDIAEERSIKLVIGDRISEVAKRPVNVKIMTMSQIIGT